MAEYFHLALADPNNTPRVIAATAVEAAISSHDPLSIYGEDLILALARAGSIAQFEAKRLLKAAYPKDFAVREWQARIRAAEETLRASSSAEGNLILTENGGIKGNVANAITVMRSLPLAWDAFACRTIVMGTLPWANGNFPRRWTDTDDIQAAEWCQHQHLDIKPQTAAEATSVIAMERCLHPVRTYLEGLKWDGKPRVDTWLTTYLGCPDSPYVQAVSAKWMIAAVQRPVEPGCQADYTLVLEGPQGGRKSTALRILGGEWFSDDLAEIGTKDSAMQLQGRWIVEVAELDAFRKAEMTTIKAWLVRRIDSFRPPYGHRTAEFPRQNVFAASTNRETWGQDETGLRRFWPVRVGSIDIEGLRRDRDQLWAEAFFRYSEGEQPWLADEAEDAATEEQADRQDADAWHDKVAKWLDYPTAARFDAQAAQDLRSVRGRVYVPEILYHCLGILPRDWNHGQKMRVGRILRLAGYVSHRETAKEAENGQRMEYWTLMAEDQKRKQKQ